MDLFSIKQKRIIKNANQRYNILSGATRSGKTYIDISFRIMERLLSLKNKNGLAIICGFSYSTIERNIIIPMQQKYGSLVGNIESNSRKMKSTHVNIMGENIILFNAGDKSRIESIRGSSVKYAYCDEVASYDSNFFAMLKSRLDKTYSICDCTCNPQSANHWFKQFMDSENIDKYVEHFCLDDNPFMSDMFKKNIKAEYQNTIFYDRYILGKWVNAEGLVFINFANDKNRWLINYNNKNHYHRINIGVDFGGNKSKTMFIATALFYNNQNQNYEVHILEEHHVRCTSSSGIDCQKIASEHFEFFNMISKKYNTVPIQTYCDHEINSINTIRNFHRNNASKHFVDKADKHSMSLNDWIMFLNSLFNFDRIKISSHCNMLIDSLATLMYDINKPDCILDNNCTDVDSYDALRYGLVKLSS